MFSLREIGEDRFVYRCNECGWESEVMTKQEAIEYTRSHECAPNAERPTQNRSFIAS
jgi:predicted nucleic acid-binding Zn ribbon protein